MVDGLKRILFICVRNANRSQMAEGFARQKSHGRFEVESAGSDPAGSVNPLVVQAMTEKGIDITAQKPKGVENFRGVAFDLSVTMGCGDSCPFVKADRLIEWDIPDPEGKPIEFVRRVRDEIEKKVEVLLKKEFSSQRSH